MYVVVLEAVRLAENMSGGDVDKRDSLKNGGHGHLEVQGLEEEEELTRRLLYRGR